MAHEKLLELKGVGHWTAQYVGLRALAHLDCLPAADVGLQKVIHYFYGLRKRPSPERVQKMGRAWRGWQSYATFYLWLLLGKCRMEESIAGGNPGLSATLRRNYHA